MRHLMDTDVPVVTRDGVALATTIWRPADERPAPVLLLRTPYGKDDVASYGGNRPNLFALLESGYAVVIQEEQHTAVGWRDQRKTWSTGTTPYGSVWLVLCA